ncbi:MAG: hypothetical protein KDK96_10545 [Chlamydiia bacterium]|nr:hypothetical protein [Chlamydiia bacterium]
MSVQNNDPGGIGETNLPNVHPKTAMHGEISQLFNISIEEANQIPDQTLEEFCIDRAKRLLESGECLTTEKIEGVAYLFFGYLWPDIETYENLKQSVDPFNPHPAFVFGSLHECIEKIDPHHSFSSAIDGRDNYINSDQQLKGIIEDPNANIKKIIEFCQKNKENPQYSAVIPQLMTKINNCPLFTARDWFGGINIHEAYILRDRETSSCRWVFKPTAEKHQQGYMVIGSEGPENTNREYTAYALNHHKQFPIPATYFVDIMGYQGSVQLFVNNAIDLTYDQRGQVSTLDLQKLFIFDLLFSNLDRHNANYLFTQAENTINVIGIDHDACMSLDGRPLKLEYLEFSDAFNQPLMVELNELVSIENLNQYENKMRDRGMDETAIQWMRHAADVIRSQIGNNETTAMQVFEQLSKNFDEEHVI